METAVANLVGDGTRVLSLVGGYFADRIAQMSQRYGGQVTRLDVRMGPRGRSRGRAPRAGSEGRGHRHRRARRDVDRRVEPGRAGCRHRARAGALTIVDAVTSLGGHPLEWRAWGMGAVLQLRAEVRGRAVGRRARRVLAGGARERRVKARSFYFDLALLEDYWVRRKYHHTICASLVYALREALLMVEEEGLEARWARHERHHLVLAAGVEAMGLSLLPPERERLWTLNAVRVPEGVDEAAVRKQMLAAVRHRGRRGPRAAGRQDLARGSDGRQLDARRSSCCSSAPSSRCCARRARRFPGRRHGGGAGRARRLLTPRIGQCGRPVRTQGRTGGPSTCRSGDTPCRQGDTPCKPVATRLYWCLWRRMARRE